MFDTYERGWLKTLATIMAGIIVTTGFVQWGATPKQLHDFGMYSLPSAFTGLWIYCTCYGMGAFLCGMTTKWEKGWLWRIPIILGFGLGTIFCGVEAAGFLLNNFSFVGALIELIVLVGFPMFTPGICRLGSEPLTKPVS